MKQADGGRKAPKWGGDPARVARLLLHSPEATALMRNLPAQSDERGKSLLTEAASAASVEGAVETFTAGLRAGVSWGELEKVWTTNFSVMVFGNQTANARASASAATRRGCPKSISWRESGCRVPTTRTTSSLPTTTR